VALRKGEHSIAVEIGVTTECEHEIGNVEKCLAAGFGRVLAVISDKRTLAAVRRRGAETLTSEHLSAVEFCTPDDMIAALDNLDSLSQERTVSGYRVKVRMGTVRSGHETSGAISRVIANAIRRLRTPKGRE